MQRSLPELSMLSCKVVLTLFISVFSAMIGNINVSGQEVIAHVKQTLSSEDGDPKFDADGLKNGTVVWKSGAVHVINGSYTVLGDWDFEANKYKEGTLIAEPGAIIKVAGEVKVENGQITSVTPAYNLGAIQSAKVSVLKLDGVTITGIDDDESGGDTDGKPGAPAMAWGVIVMSGNEKDVLSNCTIKYCSKVGGFGSIKIENNHFIKFGGLAGEIFSGNFICDVVLNAVPVITKNTFEMDTYGSNDLTGMSPVVDGNTFLGGHTATSVGTRLLKGAYADEPAGPISGRTEITNNTIVDCSDYGIIVWDNTTYFPDEVLRKTPPFNVSIRNNKLINKGKGTGIIVRLSNNAQVLYNEVDNFRSPMKVYRDDRYKNLNENEANRLKINYNKFTNYTKYSYDNDFDSTSYKYWGRGVYINAQHNYWGSPSGPEDKSNKDGLYNPYGKGMKTGNGIDYRNFIGASEEVIPDYIKIDAKANPLGVLPPTDLLEPNADYTFNVKITDFKLKSAPTGKIAVMIKDESGMILKSTTVNAANSDAAPDIPSIDVTVPENSNQIMVEASLAPDMDNAVTVYSNTAAFKVKQPQSSFQITAIKNASTGKLPALVQDSKVKLSFEFSYTLAGSVNGKLEIDLKERVTGKGTMLQDFPLAIADIAPGTNQKASKEIEIDLPVRDQEQVPQNELYYLVTMKDGQGKIAGKQSGVLPIRKTNNWVSIFAAIPGRIEGSTMSSALRQYFLVGEVPHFIIKCTYQIEKPDVANWQIQVNPLEVIDKNGKLIYSYPPTSSHWTNIGSTGFVTGETDTRGFKLADGSPALPAGSGRVRLTVKLVDPDKNMVMHTSGIYEIQIREASQTVEKDAVQGSSQVSFDQIPVKLDFKSNTSAGKITALEFQEQYRNSLGKSYFAKLTSEELFTKFIPLNRYWSVCDSLKEGSFSAAITITYDPSKDFPFTPDFMEDSLVIVSVNPNSRQLEELPSVLDKVNRTITTDYLKFYDTYIVASKGSSATGTGNGREIPETFKLYQNYPNPFNPATTISFNLPLSGYVKLSVYNILGQVERILADGFLGRGEHNIIWEIKDRSSGVYIAKLEYNGLIRYIKMMALK